MDHFNGYREKSVIAIHGLHHENAETKSSAIVTNTLYTIESNV